MRIKPGKPGLKVIDPVSGRRIPEDGSFEIVDMSKLPGELQIYWFRAFQCGDAIQMKEDSPPLMAEAKQASKIKSGGAEK